MILLLFQVVVDKFLLSSAEELGVKSSSVAGVKNNSGYSLVFHWWGLCFHCRGLGFVPVWGKKITQVWPKPTNNQTNTKKNNSMEEISPFDSAVKPSAFPRVWDPFNSGVSGPFQTASGSPGLPTQALSAPGALHSPGHFSRPADRRQCGGSAGGRGRELGEENHSLSGRPFSHSDTSFQHLLLQVLPFLPGVFFPLGALEASPPRACLLMII